MESLAAEVSLHCIICFEEFCVHDRPPVVLPCGHTYVCMVCAKRLRRCMECREPLFWTPKPNPNAQHPNPNNMNINGRSPAPPSRYGAHRGLGRYSPGPQTPPHPSMGPQGQQKEEPVPLPLPKNTVLMGMIESAARQAKLIAEGKRREEQLRQDALSCEIGLDQGEGADGEVESKLNPILGGMSAYVGACGTYAVRERMGLAVLPFDPNKNKQHHHGESGGQGEDKKPAEEEKKAEEPKEPFTIEEGRTVQVVGVDEGVYQLARGVGYIVASSGQLVKVGGPVEKSCQLEGMLDSVLKKQEEVQKELDEIMMLANGLRDQIKVEQEQPESHPVISPLPEPEHNDENNNQVASPSTPPLMTKTDSSSPIMGLALSQSIDSTDVAINDPHHHPQTPAQRPYSILLHSPAHSCPMPNRQQVDPRLDQPYMDGEPAGLPRYRVNTEDDLHGISWGFGCGTSLFGERLLEGDRTGRYMAMSFDDSMVEENTTMTTMTSHSQASAPPPRLLPSESNLQSGSFDGINFRTGMSGHSGLTRPIRKKKPSPISQHRQIRMMSEHRGVAATRGNTQNAHNINGRRPSGPGAQGLPQYFG